MPIAQIYTITELEEIKTLGDNKWAVYVQRMEGESTPKCRVIFEGDKWDSRLGLVLGILDPSLLDKPKYHQDLSAKDLFDCGTIRMVGVVIDDMHEAEAIMLLNERLDELDWDCATPLEPEDDM